MATYKVGDTNYPDFSPEEIVLQVTTTRAQLGDNAGVIHFRAKFLMENKQNIRDFLKEKVYRGNAIIPPSPWIDSTLPSPPELNFTKQANGDVLASWKNTGTKPAFRWIFYWDDGKGWKPNILTPNMTQANLPTGLKVQKIGIAGVDRLGNISETAIKEIK